eukprot:5301668-Ditylum_brightwellii.AAC.1
MEEVVLENIRDIIREGRKKIVTCKYGMRGMVDVKRMDILVNVRSYIDTCFEDEVKDPTFSCKVDKTVISKYQ